MTSQGMLRRILGLVLGLLAAICVVTNVVPFARAVDSADWPTASGRITACGVSTQSFPFVGKHGRGIHSTEHANVRYSYDAGEQPRTGDRITFDMIDLGRFERVRAWRVGDEVAVFYDADEPSLSVLDPGVSWRSFVPFALGALLAYAARRVARAPAQSGSSGARA